jgi:Mg2+-importing ATPase
MLVANTLIFGLTNLLVPWDNVDPEDLAKPVRFNLKSMPRFVIFFGTIICLFDITVFLIMIYGFGIPTANGQDDHTILLFQTVWVMENIIIQGLIIMLLRTRKIAFIQSKPGKIPFNGFIFSSLGFIG